MDIFKATDWLGITSSKGVFRTLSAILVVAAYLPIPYLDPYRELFLQVGAILGGTGLVKAYASKILNEKN